MFQYQLYNKKEILSSPFPEENLFFKIALGNQQDEKTGWDREKSGTPNGLAGQILEAE